ncbi:MAG TPA: alpha/beta fold hydrolase [Burkholderiales bacterium]|nr:alpha/beta fold hydrolase [Burkholderiales bacterium]
MKQQIRFCRSFDGTRIAFAVTGNGPPLVRAPHWFTHLEHDWNNPAMMPWVAGLSRHYSLLRFDQRGTGLSDRDAPEISFQSMVGDMASVVDAAGFQRFAILGLSQGASTAVTYAALHPERVSHLVICGGFVRGAEKRDPSPQNLERRRLQQGLIEMGWGSDDASFRQVFTSQFMPDAGLEALRAFNEMMPLSCSAETASRLFRMFGSIDRQADAAQVRCPTLVLHARGDLRIPFEEGRLVAGLIPNSRFVPLESRNHCLMESEPAWSEFLAAVTDFYPASAPAGAFSGLTARELGVLELIAQGLDNAQIAARLELSEKTVRNHITSIFDKIGVESRAQAIVLAREQGLGQRSRPS